MNTSLKIFRLFGVDVMLHWSWLLILLLYLDTSHGTDGIIKSLSVLLLTFGIVIVHEFGHILAAKKYGIMTKYVSLNILGGVAYIDSSMNDLKPKQKMWIVFAGPLTNIIMLIISIVISLYQLSDIDVNNISNISLVQYLSVISVATNAIMFVFNMLPIFPMDGGRLLRYFLEHLNVVKSLIISIRVTQIFCILLIGFAVFIKAPLVGLFGVLFFLTSISELKQQQNNEY